MGARWRQSAPQPPKPPVGDVSTRPPPGLPLLDQRAGPAGPTLWKPTRGYSTKHRQTARPHSVAAERHEPRPATKCRAKVSYLTGEQPWGVSKEGRPQSAPLWSFQGGVQRGEIEIPPLVSFLGVWGAIFSTRKRWSPENLPFEGIKTPRMLPRPGGREKHSLGRCRYFFRNSSTSSRVGIEGAAPGRETARAAAAEASFRHTPRSLPWHRPARK